MLYSYSVSKLCITKSVNGIVHCVEEVFCRAISPIIWTSCSDVPKFSTQTGRLQKQSVGWFLVSKHFSAATLLQLPSGLNPNLKQLADSMLSAFNMPNADQIHDFQCFTLAKVLIVPCGPILPNILCSSPGKTKEGSPR